MCLFVWFSEVLPCEQSSHRGREGQPRAGRACGRATHHLPCAIDTRVSFVNCPFDGRAQRRGGGGGGASSCRWYTPPPIWNTLPTSTCVLLGRVVVEPLVFNNVFTSGRLTLCSFGSGSATHDDGWILHVGYTRFVWMFR